MGDGWYILGPDHEVVRADVATWDAWYCDFGRRIVGQTDVGGYLVSTVFLGLDHRFDGDGQPVVFETLVFGTGGWADSQWRYSTWDEAAQGHARACTMVRGEAPPCR